VGGKETCSTANYSNVRFDPLAKRNTYAAATEHKQYTKKEGQNLSP